MLTLKPTISLSIVLLPLLGALIRVQPALAQSITPAADGTGTVIEYNGNTYTITGGTNAGANLFHSFEQFGLQPSEIADFLSNPAIQNVVGRVNGGDPSVIEGLLRLSGGNSNLFLVNPAGWVFTNSASVDVPGSFGVSTATRMGFGSEFFNAVGENNYAALTGKPTSLIFDSAQPGAIINDADLTVDGNLWMVGGSVINTGTINAPTGTVSLAAVPGESRVKLTHEGMALGLIVDALPAEDIQAGMPLGLDVADLGRHLTGGSHIGNAENFVVQDDGFIYLVGSESRVEDGQIVIGEQITAENVDLIAADRVKVTDLALVQGNTTVVRLPGEDGTNTLSVVDSRADDPYFLLYGGAQGTITRLINREEDGIDVITTELAEIAEQGGQVDAVSITAEGHEGNFWLGKNWITHESVADYSEQFATWGKALTESADLLLYSCFTALGATGDGDALMNSLASLTGADVAVSVNVTGSANYNGDWVLEISTGNIEASNPFDAETLDNWEGKLATLTVTNLDNTGEGSLRDRLQNDASFGDLITFSVSGTVNISGDTSGVDGDILVSDNYLTIDGNSNVTLDGGGNSRIFDIGNGVSNITIQNITLQNGFANGDGGAIRKDRANAFIEVNLNNVLAQNNVASSDGGFMQVGTSDINIVNSTITGNSVTGNKGGAFDVEDNGRMYISNSTISNNSAPSRGSIVYFDESVSLIINNSTITGNTTGDDGAFYIDEDANVQINNSVISNNSAVREGGFLWVDDFADVTVTNSTITGNTARDGGAFHIDDFDSTNITVVNSTLSGNSATQEGGAIMLGANGVANIINSTLSGNTAGNEGGAIYGDNDVIVNITNSTLSGNTAGTKGGAIYVDDLGSVVNVFNSTISGNTAATNGGGIYADRAPVNLINSTVAFNSAGTDGGGIFVRETYSHTFFNSIISNNTDDPATSFDNSGPRSAPDISADLSTSDIRHSLILDTTGVTDTSTSTVDGNTVTNTITLSTGVNGNIIGQDPLLQPLAINGSSSTQTHALAANSPAIGAGNNDLIANLGLSGTVVDIGTYEAGNNDLNLDRQWLQFLVNNELTTANNALTADNNALNTANNALTADNNALNTANSALTADNNALTTANNALTADNNALNTANNALTADNNALTTANNALTADNNALNTANSALTADNNALNTANNALTTANNALTTANNALTTANNDLTAANNDLTAGNNDLNADNNDLNANLGFSAERYLDPIEHREELVDGVIVSSACQSIPTLDLEEEESSLDLEKEESSLDLEEEEEESSLDLEEEESSGDLDKNCIPTTEE